MPRRNNNVRIRAQMTGNLRQAERDRRRKRLENRAKHPNRNVNTATYRELSDGIRV